MRFFQSIFLPIVLCFLIFCLTSQTKDIYGIEDVSTTESDSTEDVPTDIDSIPLYNITKISFDGNKHFSQRKLRDLFGWKPKKIYSRNEISDGLNRIVSSYRHDGYVFAQVLPVPTPHTGDNSRLTIITRIREGKRLRYGDFSLSGNKLLSNSDILQEMRLHNGNYFTKTSLEQGIERIQLLYSEHGYPKVEIAPTITHLSPADGRIYFTLKINEGALVRLSEIKVSGLHKTKPHIVLREIPLQVNETYHQRKIDQSYHRLRNLGFFYHIQPNMLEEGPTDDSIIFNAKVTEARTGRLIGILGYAPPVEGSDNVPQLTGVVELSETNLFGTGRNFNFYWKSGLLRSLSIGYTEPWILGRPISLGFSYSQLKQRNQFNDAESEERSGSISGNTRFGKFYKSEIIFGYKQIRYDSLISQGTIPTPLNSIDNMNPIDNMQSTLPDTVNLHKHNGSKYSVSLRFTRDSRDYYLNPTEGRRDSIAVEVSRSDFRLRKLWLDVQQYFQTWENQIIAIEIHGASAWGINIPPTELFYLGGVNSLRGYDEDWFSGPRRANATFEYRFLMGRNSQIFAFLDMGSVTFVDKPSEFDKLRVGYGIGARLESKGGIIQLDYGLAAGDSALRGKVHVKLGAAF